MTFRNKNALSHIWTTDCLLKKHLEVIAHLFSANDVSMISSSVDVFYRIIGRFDAFLVLLQERHCSRFRFKLAQDGTRDAYR